jgi:hypothetical protein
MDSWRTFQPRRLSVITTEGTLERKESGLVDWPSNCVGTGNRAETGVRECGATQFQVFWSRQARKASAGSSSARPYRKPTQVGKASSLR